MALEEAKRKNKQEEDRSRDLNQKFAALSAKLQFIEQGYDYQSNVKSMNLEVFRSIMQTNQSVSQSNIFNKCLGKRYSQVLRRQTRRS